MHIKHIHDAMECLAKYAKEIVELGAGNGNVNIHEASEIVDMVKDLAEAEYYSRISKSMEEAKEEDEAEEKYMLQRMKEEYGEDDGRKYYDEWRYSNGRYAPKGRGRRMRSYTEPKMYEVMYPQEVYRDWDRWSGDGMGRMYYDGDMSRADRTGMNSGSMRMDSMADKRTYSDGYSDGERDGNRRGYDDGNRDGYTRGYSEGQRMTQRDSREGRSGQSRRSYMESKEMHADNSPESKQAKMKDLEKYMNELASDMTEMISGASPEERTMAKAKLQNLQQKIQ